MKRTNRRRKNKELEKFLQKSNILNTIVEDYNELVTSDVVRFTIKFGNDRESGRDLSTVTV